MIIIGAKGFAKQLIDVFCQLKYKQELCFFDNVSQESTRNLYGIKIVRSIEEAKNILLINPEFCLGIGNPLLRMKMTQLFTELGGNLTSVISPKAHIASFVKEIGRGSTILNEAIIENDVRLGKGVLINTHATVHHDSIVGNFCEIAPGARLLGKCHVLDYTFIGANAVVLPNIRIGIRCIVGAGSVVTKDIPDGCTVVGVPAKPIKNES